MSRVLVTGAGGFIGARLVGELQRLGHHVRGADLCRPRFGPDVADEFRILDLRRAEDCAEAVDGMDRVFALAANMGGIGWTHAAPAEILRDNLLISTHTLDACRAAGVERVLYTSSACVYPGYLQRSPESPPLREDDVHPADPDMEYGWEKLTTEILCESYGRAYGMDIKIARLHAVYGPLGTYEGPRAKSLSALCTKVARAEPGYAIEVWGDGTQSRSFCYVDDCVEGLIRLMDSDVDVPVNIGSDERVTIADLVARIAKVAGKDVSTVYDRTKPVGPRGRVSDNTRCAELLGWAPTTTLEDGLVPTYEWIAAQLLGRPDSAEARR